MPKQLTADAVGKRMDAIRKFMQHGHGVNESCRRAADELAISYATLKDWYMKRQAAGEQVPTAQQVPLEDQLVDLLKRRVWSMEELVVKTKFNPSALAGAIAALKHRGVNVVSNAKGHTITGNRAPSYVEGPTIEIFSDENNRFIVGATGDSHLCSKYERLDVLQDLYTRFEAAGVKDVFHTGNWIDGEARFNTFDLHTHGVTEQCKYLAETYPAREGMKTYAIAGDDHEGWYAQRFGLDIGRTAEQAFRDAGREDWHDLGYMQAHVKLTNRNTGAFSILNVMHPGGGSSYAISYTAQKIVESFEGGEKPAVLFIGHYHKMECANVRNVWTLQTGCAQDQTPFMAKKRLEAHVGGVIVGMEQDPATGAIIGFTPEMMRYFNRGYYQGRWSHSGPIRQPARPRAGTRFTPRKETMIG